MRNGLALVIALALVQGVRFAQPPMPGGPPPFGRGRPPFEVIDFGPLMPVPPVVDVPFTAEALTLMVQRLPDGNRIERRMVSTLARDSRGRTRREQPMPPLGPFGQSPDVVLLTISDPVANVQYILQPEAKTAQRMPLPPAGQRSSGPPVPSGLPRPPMAPGGRAGGPPPADVRTESLGTKVINGVTVDGTRTTVRIPAGAVGNVSPIEIVTERWLSTELGIVVSSRRSDPVMGDTTFELTSLVRGEPPAELFEVPSDYSVVQRQAPPRPPKPPR